MGIGHEGEVRWRGKQSIKSCIEMCLGADASLTFCMLL